MQMIAVMTVRPFFTRGDAWRSIGYRMQWRGFPGFGKNAGFLNVSVHDEGIVVIDTQNTVSLLNPVSGKIRTEPIKT